MFKVSTGHVDNIAMWGSIVQDLSTNGFTIISINGDLPENILPEDIQSSWVLEATLTVDGLADVQPWRIAIKTTDISTELYVATPKQIADNGTIAIVGLESSTYKYTPIYSGCIGGPRTDITNPLIEYCPSFFWHRGARNTSTTYYHKGTMVFAKVVEGPSTALVTLHDNADDATVDADLTAMPITYVLQISDHGFALHLRVEGYDDYGCKQAWLCVQRAVDETGQVVLTNKAPLFALWSVNGGGGYDASYLDPLGISRMTVRESDVTVPSAPVSAVVHSADAFAVMNPLQQVPFSEDGKFDFRLPQGFNTHRHSYSYGIDLIGFASADVISCDIPTDVQVYGEVDGSQIPIKRRYRALSANSPKNTGMRLFMLEAMDASLL